jgi:SAM-dependent methyltransferase
MVRGAVYRLAAVLAQALSSSMSPAWLSSFVLTALNRKADSLPVEAGLRFLFEIDNRLYESQTRLALNLGDGHHPKGALTGYYAFFLERVRAGERVLDLGCGRGGLALAVARVTGAKVSGLDLDPANIEAARALPAPPNLTFYCGDARSERFEGTFDVVILSNLLEHLSDRVAFLAGTARTTGARRFLIRVPASDRDWRVALKRRLGVEWRIDPTHETEYTLAEFRDELAAAGLTPVHCDVRWGEIWCEAQRP